ncbi:competence protein [Bacillus xiapuensis]|uniref:competence protein n=1 Tax=Bacillus xiapuensis TaxID=2014075 RepID=UPI000C230F0A|nr:competence protein [Bacillus xiapuensis]
MGSSSKSKRFVQQGKDAIAKHDERFPYRMSYAEAEEQSANDHTEKITGSALDALQEMTHGILQSKGGDRA